MDLQKIPEWLSDDFFKSCLESDKSFPENIIIINKTLSYAVPEGNNYGSLLLRAKIEYKKQGKNHSVSLIIKAPGGIIEQVQTANDLYEREPKYYKEFIKETYKICNHNVVPKYFNSPHPSCVVLEDLTTSGYKMVDRHKLLDFDHCKLYVKASSKLHALSIALHKKNPYLIESLVKNHPTLSAENGGFLKALLSGGLKCMFAYLEDKPKYQACRDVIGILIDNDNYWALYKKEMCLQYSLTALTRADPWCTNMMFKYNSCGNVESVKLLDFQALKFTVPVSELINFIWTSANYDVRQSGLNHLYHIYCDSLNLNLKQLGCSERIEFEEMIQIVKSRSSSVLWMICALLPVCISDSAVDSSVFTTIDANRDSKDCEIYKLYQGKTFSQIYPYIIDQVIKEGVFTHLAEMLKNNII